MHLVIDGKQIKELESPLLRVLNPPGNKQSGKLPGSQNLQRRLAAHSRSARREEGIP